MKGELVNMTWDYYEIKKQELGKFGGRGMKITLDAITEKLRFFRKDNREEAEEYVRILEKIEKQAKILLDMIEDANDFYKENKTNLS